jgi:hypothetical protein
MICLCVPVVLLVDGECRSAHLDQHWFGGLFGCRSWLWALLFEGRVVEVADVVA